MRIGIIGAGGVGGYLAVRLAAAGREVRALARGAHLAAIRERGLTLRAHDGAETVARVAAASDDPADLGPVDLAVVAVKGQDLDALDLRPMIGPETALLPFLNGVEAWSRLDARYGAGRSMIGVARISATIAGPGVVSMHGPMASFLIGEPDGGESGRLRAALDAFRSAGVQAALAEDARRALWEKLAFLGPFAAATAVGRCDAETVRTTALLELFRTLVEEAAAVARAEGVTLPEGEADKAEAMLRRIPAGMRASLAHDLEAGKPLETEWLVGAVARLGAAAGVATPASRAMAQALSPWRDGARR